MLEQVIDIMPQPGSSPLFWLSMTHAQLGNRIQAREYYDRAVEQMEKKRDRRPDTKAFRTEAAEVLGIEHLAG